MSIKSQIKDQLERNFVCGDNFPRDIVIERQIESEGLASCLIEMNIDSKIMNAFLGKKSNGKFKLPTPIIISEDVEWEYEDGKTNAFSSGSVECKFEYQYFTVNDGEPSICKGKHKMPSHNLPFNTIYDLDRAEGLARAKTQQELSKMSYYDLFSKITRYDTPEKIIRLFKRNGLGTLPKDFILDIDMHSICTIDSMQKFDSYFYSLRANKAINYISNFTFSDWGCTTYVFKNEYGEPIQYVLKPLWHEYGSKSLVRCSTWYQKSTAKRRVLSIPASGVQTLYHLDLISKADQPTMILTDSLELAESNQLFAPDNIIWTSFLCNQDEFDQVDWKPLNNAEEVYYLITNHSGASLAKAYVKAEKLADYLAEKKGIQLDFIQLQIDYTPVPPRGFDTVDAMIDYRTFNKPQINSKGLVFHEDRYSFDEMCERAKKSLLPIVKREFWEDKEAPKTAIVSEPKIRKPIEFDYILYPIAAKAQTSMFYARSGLGKSCTSYSMSAATVTRSKFISGRFWNTSKLLKKDYKVLYLDYEMDEAIIADREATFVDPYFKENATLRSNLTIEPLRDKKNDYNIITAKGQRNVKKLLDKYRRKGTHDGEIDLLVIDSYTKAVGSSEFNNTWGEAEIFLSKLNKKGIAVLIIHHANQDGKSRGFDHKTDDLFAKFKIHRDEKGTLNVPFTVEVEKLRLNKVELLFKDFQAKFDGKKFVVAGENDEHALLEDIFKTYNKKSSRMTQEEIAAVVGISKNTLRKKLGLNK